MAQQLARGSLKVELPFASAAGAGGGKKGKKGARAAATTSSGGGGGGGASGSGTAVGGAAAAGQRGGKRPARDTWDADWGDEGAAEGEQGAEGYGHGWEEQEAWGEPAGGAGGRPPVARKRKVAAGAAAGGGVGRGAGAARGAGEAVDLAGEDSDLEVQLVEPGPRQQQHQQQVRPDGGWRGVPNPRTVQYVGVSLRTSCVQCMKVRLKASGFSEAPCKAWSPTDTDELATPPTHPRHNCCMPGPSFLHKTYSMP